MIVGAFITYFGVRMCVASIKNINEQHTPAVGMVAILIAFFGVWILSNSIECYQYIIHHNLMNLFF
jgi:divalent metal cation (Fe/Co/Zn/Cd) transporter